MDQLYKYYKNIQTSIAEYRKYRMEESFYDCEKFTQIKITQPDHYLIHKCINTTPQFKKLLDHSSTEPVDIIIITKVEHNIYIKK